MELGHLLYHCLQNGDPAIQQVDNKQRKLLLREITEIIRAGSCTLSFGVSRRVAAVRLRARLRNVTIDEFFNLLFVDFNLISEVN